ncbi:MAG: ATP-binding protein [Defluviitaleaceae bacterium]|nr:ATP-binding protein [Defluviitaleaceae bacterium]MCL2238981.1 ATP-binding protein [Defluviitaleaceae bacterium]
MKVRKTYLSHLLAFKDKEQVKLITGVRRCGKSTLLAQFKRNLTDSGIPKDRVIYLGFESAEHKHLKNGEALYEYIRSHTSDTEKKYVLLDEIQWVSDWERHINNLRIECNADIYLTTSGIELPASHRAFLGGQFVRIKMFPLSFKEYVLFNPIDNENGPITYDELVEMKFRDEYVKYGAMPAISGMEMPETVINAALLDMFDAAMARDVIERNTVRDAALLRSVAQYLAENIGSNFSSKKISDHLSAGGKKTTSETIDNYLNILEDAFLFYGVKRYDIKNKQHLKTLGKYYIADTGMCGALLGHANIKFKTMLENVIYFELVRKSDRVYLGKQNNYEIDFMTDSYTDRKYYQIAADIPDEASLKKALKPLEAINDNYEKMILTMNRGLPPSVNGIKIMNIIDFLLHHR